MLAKPVLNTGAEIAGTIFPALALKLIPIPNSWESAHYVFSPRDAWTIRIMKNSFHDASASLLTDRSLTASFLTSTTCSEKQRLLDDIPTIISSSIINDQSAPVSQSSSSSKSQVNPVPVCFTSSDFLAPSQSLTVHSLSAEGLKRKQPSSRFTSLHQLNFSDPDELDRYQGLMDEPQRTYWKIRNTKASPDFSKKYTSKYLESLTIQIASSAPKAGKVAYCMNSNLGKPVPCENWLLCDRCAFNQGTVRYHQLADIFDHDFRFFSVTLGFEGHLNFDSNTALNCRPYWEANKQLIRSLHDTHVINGAYLVHELKISSFLPLTANPHSHVLILSNESLSEVEQTMQEIIAGAGLVLQPSIRINEIGDTVQDQETVIRYLTKSIDLRPAYVTAWTAHCSENRDRAPELNREVRECYDAISAAFDHFKKSWFVGNLVSSSKGFIGKTKKTVISERKKARLKQKIKARRKAIQKPSSF